MEAPGLAASPPPYKPSLLATGRVKAGWGPFSQFKQLPLITPLIGGRGKRTVGKGAGVGLLQQRLSKSSGLWPGRLRAEGYLAGPEGRSLSTSQGSFQAGKKKTLEVKGSLVTSF